MRHLCRRLSTSHVCVCVCAGVDRRAVHLHLQTRRAKTETEEDGEKEGAASPVFPNPWLDCAGIKFHNKNKQQETGRLT